MRVQKESNNNRFSVEKTYQLETHWRSHAMIRIERSREIFSSQFRNRKIQNGSKSLVKMHEEFAWRIEPYILL